MNREARLGSLLLTAIGALMLFAPEALGYGGTPRSLQVITGPALASVGIVSAWPVTALVRWLAVVLGTAAIATSVFAGGPTAALVVGAVGGLAAIFTVVFLPLHVTTPLGGGWSVLLARAHGADPGDATDDPTGNDKGPAIGTATDPMTDKEVSHMSSAVGSHGPESPQTDRSTRASDDDTRREVVVVTGASAGLGRAIAHSFARRGARVALVARNQEALEAAASEVRDLGGEALVMPADVADAAAVEDVAARVEARWGAIDVWVNDAMVSVFSPVGEMAADEYRRVTEVTYLGYVHGTLAALKRMTPRDRGTIVQVGSALAYRSIPLQSAYCAAKHAVIGFTDSLRCELIHDGSRVHVTVVNMPALNTPQFRLVRSRLPRKAQPVPPIFEPEVGAEAVYWAAHQRRREVQVGAPTTLAMLGQKLAPGLMDRYLAHAAWDGQMTDEPYQERPDNLFTPVPGDHGTHGVFDTRSHAHSPWLWVTEHSRVLATAIGTAIVSTAFAVYSGVGRATRKGA